MKNKKPTGAALTLARIEARAQGLDPDQYIKGLYDLYPDLASRVPLFSYGLHGDAIAGPAATYNYNVGAWQDNPWVMKAVTVLGSRISKLDVRVVEGDGRDAQALDDHMISQLLKFPNAAMPANFFWQWWITDQMLGGEWGIELVRNQSNTAWVEMWPRQPIHFSVRPDKAKGGKRYLAVENYRIDDGAGDPFDVDPTDFIHFKFFNPQAPYRGISPMTAIRLGVKIDALAQGWALNFFRNQARPDMAIIAETGMSATEKREMIADLKAQLGGNNSHGVVVLEEDIQDIKTFSHSAKDTEWLAQREFSRDEVGGIFGVPDEIMGYGRDTYENFKTADQVLWTGTLLDLITFRDVTLTHHFSKVAGVLKPGQTIKTDLSGVPQLQEDLTEKLEQGGKLFAMGYAANIINERLNLGMPDIQGGDQGWLPFSLIPANTGSSRADDDQDDTDQRHWNEVALLFNGLDVKALPAPAVTKNVPDFGSEGHARLWAGKQQRISNPVDQMKRKVKRFVQDQQNRVGAALRSAQQLDFGHGHHKGADDIPDLGKIFDKSAEVQLFIDTFGEVLFEAFRLVAAAEWDTLPIDELAAALDIDSPTANAAVAGILETVANETQNSTWTGLTDLFKEAEAAGETIPLIQDRLATFYKGKKEDWQTERIARTTMTAVDNAGSLEAWQQSGVVASSIWISALIPSRSRASHMAAHGQERRLGEMFEVEGEALQFPGDPNGSPGNIINCLCTTIPKVIE